MNAYLMLLLLYVLGKEVHGASLKKENVKKIFPKETMGKILKANEEKEIPFFEGDIVLHSPKLDKNRNAITDPSSKWTTNIPYVIHSEYSFEVKEAIEDAMREFNVRLCVHFAPRQNEANYILFKKDGGCFSSVGMVGGEQVISLDNGCESPGVIRHEIIHALGFWHEQSRYDRDNFVEIMWDNIQSGKEHNFNKYSEDQITTLGEAYDYSSLMHYNDHAFSSNGEPTIVAKQEGGSMMGQREKFSDIDLNKLRKLYECAEVNGWTEWTEWSDCDIQCKKHRKKFCEGQNCTNVEETEETSCDSTCKPNTDPDCPPPHVTASYGTVTSSMFPFEYKSNVECTQTITVPAGETIRLEFEFMDIEHYQGICYYDWLNIYDGAEKSSPSLGSFCGTTTPLAIQSSGNQLTLSLFSDSSISFRGYLANFYSDAPGSPLGICHFEGDISACGWTHDSTGDFQWAKGFGSTSSSGTGPSYDHTSGQDQGHYMYLETSSPQTSGMLARLKSPLFESPVSGHCLEFYYNMFGENIDTLTVLQEQEVSSGTFEKLTIFSMLGNHGNDDWIQAKISIYGQFPYKLVFQGKRGNGWMGDIAIDDVTVLPHACNAI